MHSEENEKQLNKNQQEMNDISEQNSIMENDYTDLNKEIAKIVLEHKDSDENSQNDIFDNVQGLLNNTMKQEKGWEEHNNNILNFHNKNQPNKNQNNIFQSFNYDCFFKNNTNSNFQEPMRFNLNQGKQSIQNQKSKSMMSNNYYNNNINDYSGINKFNTNFINSNQINPNNELYYNKIGTPNFNCMNNALSPVIYEQNFYSPIPSFPFMKGNNCNINKILDNNNFHSIQINNLASKNSNDEIILDNMIIKQNKFKKNNHNNILYNNYNLENYGNSNNNKNIRNQGTNKKNISENEKNKIDILNIILQKDKRTTLMIKNIPNKYTINLFLEEINIDFKDKYDIFYLPIDYENKCNLGFAFINFVESLHIIEFYDLYRGKKWKKFNSEKICELVYAKFQGKKELINHFEKGKVLSFECEEKRPLILPTPNPLPKISIPIKYLELFKKCYPFVKYSIIINKNDKENIKFILHNFFSL